MSTAADGVIATARSQKGSVTSATDCASFVSGVIAESGVAPTGTPQSFTWSGSSWVPTIVGEFPPADISGDLSSAQPGDLIVFGSSEHIMIYSGNGNVIGTATGTDGVTKVVEVAMSSVSPGATAVLHTGLQSGGTLTSIPTAGAGYGSLTNPGAIPGEIASGLTGAASSAVTNLFDAGASVAIGTLFAWVPGFAVQAGILLVAAVLVFVGLKQLLAGAEEAV
jgi:hypothetical protein